MEQHKRKKVISGILQYICLFAPYLIIMLVKHETYFTEKNGISMGIGCVCCVLVAGIIASKKIKLLKGIGGFVAIILISWLMDAVIDDLTIIGIWGLVGYLVSLFFESRYNYHKRKELMYDNANINKEVNS